MNKKQIIYLVIFIAVILISLVGATYAYFESSTNMDNAALNSNVVTANSSVFSAYSEGNIEFNITMDKMTQAGISTNVIATDNAIVNITASSGNPNTTLACTYDLVWVWDSTDRYTEADIELPYYVVDEEKALEYFQFEGIYEDFLKEFGDGTKEENEKIFIQVMTSASYTSKPINFLYKYPYELAVQVADEEYDLSALDWQEDGSALITSKVVYSRGGNEINDIYDVKVNAYNIPVDQQNLFNKNFKAHIEVRNSSCTAVEESLAQICNNGEDLSDCIKRSYAANGINGIYLHDSSLAYGANDNSYRYAGLEYDETGWESLVEKEGYTYTYSILTESSKIYYENTSENVEKMNKFDDIFIKSAAGNKLSDEEMAFMQSFEEEFENGSFVYYTKEELQKKLASEGKVFRIVKNYVCFEGDDCTNEDNIYQILGIFDNEAKLVKYKSIDKMPWDFKQDGTYSNNWEGSTLEGYLNSNEAQYTYYTAKYDSASKKYILDKTLTKEGYLHSLGNKTNLIANHDWQVGEIDINYMSNPKMLYDAEYALNKVLNRKIGLVYLSDLTYSTKLHNNIDLQSSWVKGYNWTMTKNKTNNYGVYRVSSQMILMMFGDAHIRTFADNIIYSSGVYSLNDIKPAFYLNANVKYKGGEGTLEKPIIIGM